MRTFVARSVSDNPLHSATMMLIIEAIAILILISAAGVSLG